MHVSASHRTLLAILLIPLLLCCSRSESPSSSAEPAGETEAASSGPSALFVETGDLQALKKRGIIRLLAPRWDISDGLPRQGLPVATYRILAETYVTQLGLTPQWIFIDKFEHLIDHLLAGQGDIIVTNLTETPARSKRISYSLPISHIREVILTASSSGKITGLADLINKTVVIPSGSSYKDTLTGIDTVTAEVDSGLGPDEILDLVISGEYDATLMDSNQAKGLLQYRDDFRIAFDLSDERNIAWAARPDSIELLQSLNLFITEVKLSQKKEDTYKADLSGIKQRKTLRVLTHNGPATYFLWRGELLGFDYEIVKQFSKELELRLEIVVPTAGEDILEWLAAGRGDMVAAAMTITDQRLHQGFAFSQPYNQGHEVFVTNGKHLQLRSLQDLEGHTIVANPDYSYWESLTELKQAGLNFQLTAAPADLGTAAIIEGVATGEFEATLADSNLVDIEKTFLPDLDSELVLGDPVHHGWIVREEDQELLDEINRFLKREYRSRGFNLVYNKYFKNPKRILQHEQQRVGRDDALSPFDAMVKRHAPDHHFDWRLIVSQMYQESRFDPNAKSFAGALGLLQLLPNTAVQVGIDKSRMTDPETSIRAGVSYLAWTRDRFASTLPVDERLWFSLAGYNAGYGHVHDARRLAKQMGWDQNVWFDNVEKAILLLSKREYARRARFGYCRGSEPVRYISEIRDRYQAYLALSK
tara:strand:+ start:11911 stop:14022 length:2112 start_codon:yes stop_codon:yes gene_type:complete